MGAPSRGQVAGELPVSPIAGRPPIHAERSGRARTLATLAAALIAAGVLLLVSAAEPRAVTARLLVGSR